MDRYFIKRVGNDYKVCDRQHRIVRTLRGKGGKPFMVVATCTYLPTAQRIAALLNLHGIKP